MQRKRRRNSTNKHKTNHNSTNGVRWTSPHLKNRTRSSREMTPYSRITGWFYTIINTIPSIAVLVLLFGLIVMLNPSSSVTEVYAAVETKGDSTASITLDTSKITVDVAPGSIGYASKDISISTNNIESYTLSITGPEVLYRNNGNGDSDNTNDIDITSQAESWSYAYITDINGSSSGENSSINDEALDSLDYTNFTGATQTLESSNTTGNPIVTNATRTLAFRASFSNDAIPGHYSAEITLSLAATPRYTTYILSYDANGGTGTVPATQTNTNSDGSYTFTIAGHGSLTKPGYIFLGWSTNKNATSASYKNSDRIKLLANDPSTTLYAVWLVGFGGITEMQQMTSSICSNVSAITTGHLQDNRDGKIYSVAKFSDGKCWMTENLRLKLSMSTTLTSSNTNVGNKGFTPTENTLIGSLLNNRPTDGCGENFPSGTYLGSATVFCYYKAQSYAQTENSDTYYYSWTAATAGTGNASMTQTGANASGSICPKGWRLPTGFNSNTGVNDFRTLFLNLGLSISNNTLANSQYGETSWGSGDLNKIQSAPYDFRLMGYVNGGVFGFKSEIAIWWSSTVRSDTNAYDLQLTTSKVAPGTSDAGRTLGALVRCITQ